MSFVARSGLAACFLSLIGFHSAPAQTNVLTQHNDIGRTGQNTTETILTPASVSSGNFGLIASLPIDGPAFAQPLYMSSLSIGGTNHSVVFAVTAHDSVYAYDSGAAGQLLWKASLFDTAHGAPAGSTADPEPDTGCLNANGPELGAMGTPVIDPNTNTIYLVSRTFENNYVVQRLHALDVTSGAEKFGGPVTIQATVPGTGNGSVNGQLSFDPKWNMQRPGLLLINGTVYIAWGSVCDFGTWHGWMMGYNAATMAQTSAFVTTPNGTGSGIWMSGAGLAADNENGVPRAFIPTGNGTYDATPPYGTNTMDYGDDILTVNLSNKGIQVTDAFTPSNQAYLEQNDVDVSAGGVIVLPDNMPGASVPHETVNMSKFGAITILNRDNLGGYNTTDQVLQEFNPTLGFAGGLWGMPAYWNGNLYVWPSHDAGYNLQQYKFTNGLLGTTPFATSTQSDSWQNGQFLGASPSVSSNGNTNGILWVDDTGANLGGTPQFFYALDATNVANTLWSSTANTRDNAGIDQHFAFPTIADGKVYLASIGNLLVYGMLDFSMTAPSSVSVNPGNNTVVSIPLTSSTSFTQGVTFNVSGVPSSVSVSFAQAANGSSTALFTASSSATPGTSNITITGSRGTTTQTATVSLTVGGLADFILSAAPATVDLGTTAYSAVTATPQSGFAGTPSYSIQSVPAGLSATLSGCSATGCTLLTTASPTMTVGNYTIVIQATSGTLAHLASTIVNVSRTSVTNVDLSRFYNVSAIASDGTAPLSGGLDGYGYALSGTLLGSSTTWAATTFKFGPVNAMDAVSNQTVALPAGYFLNLQLLATGGSAIQQPVVVTYTDGSTATLTQSFSNWGSSSGYFGEAIASSLAYRLLPNGTTQSGPWYIYGYTFPLNSSKVVQSLTLPPTGSVVVLAAALSSSSAVAQTIFFNPIPAQQAGTSLPLSATTSSGLAVGFTSSTSGICTVSGNSVTFTSGGTCTIIASQAGNSVYAAANQVSQSLTVAAPQVSAQTITFAGISPQTIGSSVALTATATSGLAVTFASTTPAICAVSGSTVTAVAAGSCAIVASQSGNSSYAAATPITQSFTVTPVAQTISFATVANQQAGASVALTATATSGLAVTLASTTPAICAVSGSTVTAAAAGSCAIVASQSGNSTYAAATPVTQSFTVTPVAQTITFATVANQQAGASVALTATATSGVAVTFASSTPAVCTVSGSTVTAVAGGSCAIVASQAGNSSYAAATPVTQSFTVTPLYQVPVNLSAFYNIDGLVNSGTAPLNGGFDGAGYAYAANLFGGSVAWAGAQFTLGTPNVANSVSSATIPLPVGSFTSLRMLAAASFGTQTNQPFVLTYSDGTKTTLTQSLSDWGAPASYAGESIAVTTPYRITPNGTSQSFPWNTYGYSFPVNSAKTLVSVTLPNNRQVVVLAMTLASASPIAQSISFGAIANQQINSPVTLSATASSGLPITFASTTPSVCTVSGTTATAVAGGTCTIAATQPGNINYAAAASVSQSFTVSLASQSISFGALATQRAGTTVALTATATSGLAVAFASSTTGVCTVSGTSATLLATGTCTIAASQPGNSIYAAATPVSQGFTVAPPQVQVNLSSVSNVYGIFTNGSTVSNGGLDGAGYAFSANLLGSSAIWNGATFNFGSAGVADAVSSVKVPLPAGNFASLQVLATGVFGSQPNQTFVVTYTDGTSTNFTQGVSEWGAPQSYPGESIAVSMPYRITPNGSTQAVLKWDIFGYSFALNSAKTASSITLPNNRSVVVMAMTLSPSAIAQTINFVAVANQVVGTPLTLTATASSGLAVSYASSTTGVCAVSGSTATMVAAGTCALTAAQAGNSNYAAATPVSQLHGHKPLA